jgi:hypothetical protein
VVHVGDNRDVADTFLLDHAATGPYHKKTAGQSFCHGWSTPTYGAIITQSRMGAKLTRYCARTVSISANMFSSGMSPGISCDGAMM